MIATVAAVLSETLMMTGLLIGLVLLLRRPVARMMGAQFAYALWLIPSLRLLLPPLPGGEEVVALQPPSAMGLAETGLAELPLDAVATSGALAAPTLFDQMALLLPLIWLAGMVAVIAMALVQHYRWHRTLMKEATPLAPVNGIRLVMSGAVDGPIATGLLRPMIAVPIDFFVRYNRTERRLAIAHELAHHRSGDLWANAAALLVLAAQWFNPFAWIALRAFRFDQEAACDVRVLDGLAATERGSKAHSYACAIAKSLTGPRLVLAAPMTSGTDVKERLQMLSHNPQLGPRPILARAILGGATVGALALTISSLPSRVVYAAEPSAAPAAQDTAASPDADKKRESRVFIIDATADGEKGDDSQKKVSRILFAPTDGDDAEAAKGAPRIMMFRNKDGGDATGAVKMVQVTGGRSMSLFGMGSDDLRATLKEQGIDDAKADAIVKQMEEKRGKSMRISFNGADFADAHIQIAKAHSDLARARAAIAGANVMALTKCKEGETPRVMIDRSGEAAGAKAKVRMVNCTNAAIPVEKQIEAMKRARDRLAAQKDDGGMGADIRASVIADLNKSIAELEAKKD